MIFKNATPGTIFRYGPDENKQIYLKIDTDDAKLTSAVNVLTGELVMILDDKTIEAVEPYVSDGNYIIPMDNTSVHHKPSKKTNINNESDTLKDIIICLEKERFGL